MNDNDLPMFQDEPYWPPPHQVFDDSDVEYDEMADGDCRACPECGGDGMEDDITLCSHCDGEGVIWWEC